MSVNNFDLVETSISLGDLLNQGTTILKKAKVIFPYQSSLLIMQKLLKMEISTIIAHPELPIPSIEANKILTGFLRNAKDEPLQYIINEQEFYGRVFFVSSDVLIPRPETEILIDITLKFCQERKILAPYLVDIGTGSGCLAITLAMQIPEAQIIAIDISPAALEVARINAVNHNVTSRITFLESNFLETVTINNFADVVISNPPYIALDELQNLDSQVKNHEPFLALVSGDTGLESYVKLFTEVKNVISPNGIFACEVGYKQAELVIDLGRNFGWKCKKISYDLQKIARALTFEMDQII